MIFIAWCLIVGYITYQKYYGEVNEVVKVKPEFLTQEECELEDPDARMRIKNTDEFLQFDLTQTTCTNAVIKDPVRRFNRCASKGYMWENDTCFKPVIQEEPISEKPGWSMAEATNFWSVNEKDPHWQTEEGYQEAMNLYGFKPGWVTRPDCLFITIIPDLSRS